MESIQLSGIQVQQGNGNGQIISRNRENCVLATFDMGPCVAVCGFNDSIAFMIHSDSMRDVGVGKVDLITGLKKLVPELNDGNGLTITLFGGRSKATQRLLDKHLPQAKIETTSTESDSAYLTNDGFSGPVKRILAEKLHVDSIDIFFDESNKS